MNIVVLLAGGKGIRMCQTLPKQHITLEGHQIIEYTLMAFSKSTHIDAIMVVTNPEYYDNVVALKQHYHKLKWVIHGGTTRISSVKNAVDSLNKFCVGTDKILFSDAVRPCITLAEIERILECLDEYTAVTTGVEVYETVLVMKDNQISSIIPRDGVVRQTSPEGYLFKTLVDLYMTEKEEKIALYKNIGIDQLFEKGVPIGFVKSSPFNFKITVPEDIVSFETVLKQGFDEIISRRY